MDFFNLKLKQHKEVGRNGVREERREERQKEREKEKEGPSHPLVHIPNAFKNKTKLRA